MKAFHGDVTIKEKYLTRVRQHREADELMQGTGWENGRGCAVGCTLEAYDHGRYPIELGIPVEVAHLEDLIFEDIPTADAMLWPDRFLTAIPVGSDLSMVWPMFAVWLLTKECPSVVGKLVAGLYQRRIDGDEPSAEEWRNAQEAAREAKLKASSWALHASIRVAQASAWAAEASGAGDAWAEARTAWAARAAQELAKALYLRSADKLIGLLEEAK